jgi:PIN domain nuclease of toxin-antitoxin system
MTRAVLDTSALLALCFAEKGATVTTDRGQNGIMSAVSYSEAIAKSLDYNVPIETVRRALAGLDLTIMPFDEPHAVAAASFRPATRKLNVSFADRACLGTAALTKLPVLTADRKWEKIECGLDIIYIR